MSSKKAASARSRGDLEEDDDSSSSSSSSGSNNPRTDPKADEIVKNADKRLKEWGIFSGNQKYEDACEMLAKAAAMYKINKNWKQAGDCYVRIAEIQITNLKDSTDACNKYVDAAKAYKNSNPKDAQKYFQKAVEMHMENNRTSTAAKLWKELAELNEKDMNIKAAIEAYQKAADCYQAEDSNINANAMRIKIAGLAADDKDYARAIEIYENVSKASLDSNAGKWSVKDYLFKALLCHLALAAKSGDMGTVEEAAQRYRDLLPQLDGTREIKLIDDAVESFKEEDLDRFREAVKKFDQIVRLDNFTASILIDVQNALENGPSEAAGKGGDDGDDLT